MVEVWAGGEMEYPIWQSSLAKCSVFGLNWRPTSDPGLDYDQDRRIPPTGLEDWKTCPHMIALNAADLGFDDVTKVRVHRRGQTSASGD